MPCLYGNGNGNGHVGLSRLARWRRRRGARDHDNRHAPQGFRRSPFAIHHRRNVQGRGNDSSEHGNDARGDHHRRAGRARCVSGRAARRGESKFQSHQR